MARLISVVIINASAFVMMLGVGMIVALLPQRMITISGSVSSVGYLASAFALTFVLFQIPVGKFSDKLGFKPFLAGGYFICSATGIVYYFADSPGFILFGRMLQGMGEIPIWALAPALMSVLYPDEKGKFMGIYNASLHCGLTAGSILGVWISNVWQGNQPFLVFAVMSFIGGVLIVLFVNNQPRQTGTGVAQIDFRKTSVFFNGFTNRVILMGIVLYGTGYGIFVTVIPAYLFTVKNMNQTTAGIFFGLFYVALGLSQLIVGPFSDLKGRKPAILCGLTMATAGIAAFPALDLPWTIGMLTLAALGLGTFCISAMAFLNECGPDSLKGTISGIFYFSWGLGYFFGPLVLGKIGQSGYWQLGFGVFAVVLMSELIVCAIVLKGRGEMVKERVVTGGVNK